MERLNVTDRDSRTSESLTTGKPSWPALPTPGRVKESRCVPTDWNVESATSIDGHRKKRRAIAKVIDDDAGHLEWTESHPLGFVLNCERTPRGGRLILHRSTCLHITEPGPQATRWTADYIKVCSENKEALNKWAEVETGGQPTHCQTCAP